MVTEKPPIYVDIDDVLCETTREILRLAETLFGRAQAFEQITSFDLAAALSLEPDQHHRLLEVAEADETIERYPPIAGARRVLKEWHRRGYRICLVTGRRPETEAATRRWLNTHAIPYDELLFVDKYGRYRDGYGVNLETLAARKFCLAIEDSLTMARFLAERASLRVVLFSRPWNVSADWHSTRVLRVNDWTDIAEGFPAP